MCVPGLHTNLNPVCHLTYFSDTFESLFSTNIVMVRMSQYAYGLSHLNKCMLLFSIFFAFTTWHVNAQRSTLDVGVRLQKTINLYYENGITVQYSDDRLLDSQLFFGISYVTSRLGSASRSHAIKQDNFLLSSTYYFRPLMLIQPFVRVNTGFFIADYEYPVFDVLPNTSILLSPEAGVSLNTNLPLKIGVGLGYNLITGDGVSGPGTLYPLFIQTSVTWNILEKCN